MSYIKKSVKGILISIFFYLMFIYESEEELFWKKPIDERLRLQLYPVERHYILTEDKFNITLFRVGKKGLSQVSTRGKPVIFVPQFLNCIDTYVSNEDHLAPALVFANQGFDVWLMSQRGGEYSPNEDRQDGFSFHEIGYFDLPKSYEYIYSLNPQNITAVGHSQGGNTIFVSLTEKRLKNVHKIIMFAPGPFAKNATGLIPYFVSSRFVDILAKYTDRINLTPSKYLFKLCKYFHLPSKLFLTTVTDTWESDMNIAKLYQYTKHSPQPQSIKNLLHLKQLLIKGQFYKYDYGQEQNLKIYGQEEAPLYDLLSITESIHLFYGPHDILTRYPDNIELYEILKKSQAKNVTFSYYPTVGHVSFILDSKAEFLQEMIKIIEED
ncbi:ab-hydrolase associated lipase region family protein (macronuclear) [Tetrahymena thermophila SB210]|uniref:Ab-hydrolase associated lipase region family protein n=1 Tax=Tetrahymena thermophila (strain SB210) TaxID=312017 RepID=I7MI40_TETTS|nr:ab-hydrolase associated lipase region family protein [Tetrahymena thermophila SB210]EAR90851.1 ab-hydrolase associated lipase region family protein [Tetrahymena thermophila SB210]|eukprot:XP_001011096.1 ab-hydrolase associated lipase region family protein [Tetrahymena thermophila SB210]